jgi:hypothetical protein
VQYRSQKRSTQALRIDVVDGTGRVVAQIAVGMHSGNSRIIHTTSHLPNGIYRHIANGPTGVVGATTMMGGPIGIAGVADGHRKVLQ